MPTPLFEPTPPRADPRAQLAQIAQVSQNARATWFGLLGLLAFVGVTLLGHQDADFFTREAATQLPLVNITVPVKSFFYTAPILVAALYAYFHLYLMTLWEGLAEAPAKVEGQPLSDRVFPWLISHAALWYRNRRRQDGSAAPRALGLIVVAVSLLLGWLFGIMVLGGLWIRSMPLHDEWLTLWIGACFWFAFLIGQTGLLTLRARMGHAVRADVAAAHWGRRVVGTLAAAILVVISWARTEGGFENYAHWISQTGARLGAEQSAIWISRQLPTSEGIESWLTADLDPPQHPSMLPFWSRWLTLYPADLEEAELTPRPADWKPFELWLRDYRKANDGDQGAQPLIPTADEIERYRLIIAALNAPTLTGRDLRRANLVGAFLPGADLRQAQIQGANLFRAQIQGAVLQNARMEGANLRSTQIQGADLFSARMQGADLSGAEMQGADLRGAEMQGVSLRDAQMQGADLSEAKLGAEMPRPYEQRAILTNAAMQGAVLHRAEMQWAVLSQARMQGADLSSAEMQGANLGGAEMQGADLSSVRMFDANLSGAKMQGAVLFSAWMVRADLSTAEVKGAVLYLAKLTNALCSVEVFLATVVHNADLTCLGGTLWQEQLDFAVGNGFTRLPAGLHVWSCLDPTEPRVAAHMGEIEAALQHHPEPTDRANRFRPFNRKKVRDLLFCDPNSDDPLRRSPHKVGRWPEPEGED